MSLTNIFKKIFGSKADRDMKVIKPVLDKVLAAYQSIDSLSDDQLRDKCQALKDKIQAAIAADEARIAEIKLELEKEIPLNQKEKLATESDKLVKKVDETIEKVLDEILPEAFAIMKSTARRFKDQGKGYGFRPRPQHNKGIRDYRRRSCTLAEPLDGRRKRGDLGYGPLRCSAHRWYRAPSG